MSGYKGVEITFVESWIRPYECSRVVRSKSGEILDLVNKLIERKQLPAMDIDPVLPFAKSLIKLLGVERKQDIESVEAEYHRIKRMLPCFIADAAFHSVFLADAAVPTADSMLQRTIAQLCPLLVPTRAHVMKLLAALHPDV